MLIEYIRENNETKYVYKMFNIFKVENIEQKIIINIPINQFSRTRKVKKNAEKLSKYLYNNNIKTVVLSKGLMKNETFKNILYSNNVNILDGNKLSKFLTYNIIQKIYEYKNKQIEAGEITILVNENDDINIQNIIKLAHSVKRLNIITNETRKFRTVVKYLYNELGIIVKLTNNMKTNLTSSDIILNIDFPEEWVNQLNIPCNAVIVSIPDEIKILSKRFTGVNIKNWSIELPEKYNMDGFDENIIYEATLCNKRIDEVYKKIDNDAVKIKKLLGINGVISKTEFV